MRIQKKSLKKFARRCAAFYHGFTYYLKRVRMIETELGSRLEVC